MVFEDILWSSGCAQLKTHAVGLWQVTSEGSSDRGRQESFVCEPRPGSFKVLGRRYVALAIYVKRNVEREIRRTRAILGFLLALSSAFKSSGTPTPCLIVF